MPTPSNPFKPPAQTGSGSPAGLSAAEAPVVPGQDGNNVAPNQQRRGPDESGGSDEAAVAVVEAPSAPAAPAPARQSAPVANAEAAPPPPPPAASSAPMSTPVAQSRDAHQGFSIPEVPGGFPEQFQALVTSAERIIRGKTEVLQQAVVCMLAGGHLLLEDVPGVGKTSLAKAIALSVDLHWNRVQFTPDLLPSDVTGVSIFNQKTLEFEFRPGPVFTNIIVGDEINRASPKTQSALLEVMEEGTVTVDGHTYPVPQPFMVVATQNPIDLEGTYRLPEAQVDRFLMKLSVGYPDAQAEREVITTHIDGFGRQGMSPAMSAAQLQSMIEFTKRIELSGAAKDYAVALCEFTRGAPEVRLGVSPRGSLALARAARVVAAAVGRPFATADDMKQLAPAVLTHRVIVTAEAELQGTTAADVISRALAAVPVPRTRAGG